MSLAAIRFELAEEMYRRKIRTFARKEFYNIPGYQAEDLESDILEVLWACVRSYNPDNGARFSTFFWSSAKNKLMDLYRFYGAKKRYAEVVYLDGEVLAQVMDGCQEDFSAEDWALALVLVEQRMTTYVQ